MREESTYGGLTELNFVQQGAIGRYCTEYLRYCPGRYCTVRISNQALGRPVPLWGAGRMPGRVYCITV